MFSNSLQEVKESTLESIQIYQELVDRLCDKQVYSIVSDCWSETMRLGRLAIKDAMSPPHTSLSSRKCLEDVSESHI